MVYNGAKTIQIDRGGRRMDITVPDDFIAQYIEKKSFVQYAYPFEVREFTKDAPAQIAGLEIGDRIVGINGKDARFYELVGPEIEKHKGEPIALEVERNGQRKEFTVLVAKDGKIGMYPVDPRTFFELEEVRYGFFASVPAGISKGVATIKAYLKDLKLVFTPETGAYKSLGGFIAIGNIFPGNWNWNTFWNMTAFLSIMLAVLNILPIPALDGGHVLFLIVEMITGRRPSDKFMEYAQITGMILLLALVLYANGNDIIKLFTR